MALHNITSDRDFVFDVVMLKDDTEEDLVGSDLHQTAIRRLADSLWLVGPGRGLPWHVSSQLMVQMGKVLGKDWNPSPDVFVHPTAGPAPRTSFDISVEGVPPFVIEVASPSTCEYDTGPKGRSYGYVGVQEYLVFDPTTDLLGMPIRAWHTSADGFTPWQPAADGLWYSEVLRVYLQPQGPLLRVLDGNRVLVPTIDEQARQAAEQARRVNEQARQIADLEAEVLRLRAEREHQERAQ